MVVPILTKVQIGVRRLSLTILLLLGGTIPGFSQVISTPTVALTLDFSNAKATLAALDTSADITTMQQNMTDLPATKAVLKKVQGREASVTMETFWESLQRAKAGTLQGNDPFRWQLVNRKRDEIKNLLQHMEKEQETIRARLSQKLGVMLASTQTLHVTVHFVVGSASAGWATDAQNLYIGMHFYDGDYDGVLYTLQHELFHNVQFLCYTTEATDLKKLSSRQKEVFALLKSLFIEGTATYFSDVEDFPSKGGFIKEMLTPQRENIDRMPENFILLDLFLYRLSRDKNVSFDDIYSVGFDWSWKNPMYFTGYAMCKALVKAHGDTYLKQSLNRNPVHFVADYIKLCAAQGKSDKLPNLSPDSVRIVSELQRALNKSFQ